MQWDVRGGCVVSERERHLLGVCGRQLFLKPRLSPLGAVTKAYEAVPLG